MNHGIQRQRVKGKKIEVGTGRSGVNLFWNYRYFVKNHENNVTTTWWNGNAAHIDFTNAAAYEWFRQRLESLKQTVGIDSFKFDAGESDWAPAVRRTFSNFHKHTPSL